MTNTYKITDLREMRDTVVEGYNNGNANEVERQQCIREVDSAIKRGLYPRTRWLSTYTDPE